MVGGLSAQIGLLAFAVAIIAGLSTGNSAVTILLRAIISMFAALLVAQLAAWCAKQILRDHLQKSKRSIDEAHIAALREHDDEEERAAPAGAADDATLAPNG